MSKVEKGLFQGIFQAAHEVGGQMGLHIAISPPPSWSVLLSKAKVGRRSIGGSVLFGLREQSCGIF